MMYAIYKADDGTKYLFQANSPYNAMEKMLYTLNLSQPNTKAEIKEACRGYILIHGSKEFWISKQAQPSVVYLVDTQVLC